MALTPGYYVAIHGLLKPNESPSWRDIKERVTNRLQEFHKLEETHDEALKPYLLDSFEDIPGITRLLKILLAICQLYEDVEKNVSLALVENIDHYIRLWNRHDPESPMHEFLVKSYRELGARFAQALQLKLNSRNWNDLKVMIAILNFMKEEYTIQFTGFSLDECLHEWGSSRIMGWFPTAMYSYIRESLKKELVRYSAGQVKPDMIKIFYSLDIDEVRANIVRLWGQHQAQLTAKISGFVEQQKQSGEVNAQQILVAIKLLRQSVQQWPPEITKDCLSQQERILIRQFLLNCQSALPKTDIINATVGKKNLTSDISQSITITDNLGALQASLSSQPIWTEFESDALKLLESASNLVVILVSQNCHSILASFAFGDLLNELKQLKIQNRYLRNKMIAEWLNRMVIHYREKIASDHHQISVAYEAFKAAVTNKIAGAGVGGEDTSTTATSLLLKIFDQSDFQLLITLYTCQEDALLDLYEKSYDANKKRYIIRLDTLLKNRCSKNASILLKTWKLRHPNDGGMNSANGGGGVLSSLFSGIGKAVSRLEKLANEHIPI